MRDPNASFFKCFDEEDDLFSQYWIIRLTQVPEDQRSEFMQSKNRMIIESSTGSYSQEMTEIPILIHLIKYYLAYHKISNQLEYHLTMIDRLTHFLNKLSSSNLDEAIDEFLKPEESLLQFYNINYDSNDKFLDVQKHLTKPQQTLRIQRPIVLSKRGPSK